MYCMIHHSQSVHLTYTLESLHTRLTHTHVYNLNVHTLMSTHSTYTLESLHSWPLTCALKGVECVDSRVCNSSLNSWPLNRRTHSRIYTLDVHTLMSTHSTYSHSCLHTRRTHTKFYTVDRYLDAHSRVYTLDLHTLTSTHSTYTLESLHTRLTHTHVYTLDVPTRESTQLTLNLRS